MNITQYKEILIDKSTDFIKRRLQDEIEKIEFLESIYITGGKYSHFSEKFRDAAFNERQELCQLTSACHSILRERTERENA